MVRFVPRSEPWSSVKSLVDLTPVSCTGSSFLGSGKIVGLDLGVFLRLDLKLPPFNTFCQIDKTDHKNKISINYMFLALVAHTLSYYIIQRST